MNQAPPTNQTTQKLGISGRIAEFFLQHSMTPLLALIALLLGVFATLITPREEEPQIDVTMANVLVPFPGATAKDVEALVAQPAERVFSRMAGVDHVYSVSRPGMAILTVQFKVGVPNQTALVRLYDTVHSNRDWLAANLGVGEPVVKPKGIDDVPIVSLTLWSKNDSISGYELQQIARRAEQDLKHINGTRDITTIGGPGHAVRVILDSDRMSAANVTAPELRAALLSANSSSSSGNLVSDGKSIEVQTGTYLDNAEDVGSLVIAAHNGRPVYLRDVADVIDGADQANRYVWHGIGKSGGSLGMEAGSNLPAVTLAISKKPGVNAADVADGVIQRMNSLKGSVIPEGVEFTVTRNYGETATEKAQKLIGKLIFATTFVVLLVLFALGKREAIIVGTAVTLTLAATLFASWAWGFTLNRVSLFALIFSIGILVDDAIVVVENIHRWQQLHPEKPLWQLIPKAVDEVGGPTILATFTVIAALLPMAFVSGLMGPYMSPIPINASMGMFISLAIAFIITPWLALKLMKGHVKPAQHGTAGDAKTSHAITRLFQHILPRFLDPQTGPSARRKLWLGVLLAIVLSVSLGVVKLVVLKMLPFDNKSEFQVVLDMPVGTPLEETNRVLQDIGSYLATVDDVRDFQAYVGTASPINFNGLVRQYYLRNAPEMGDIQVNLVDKHHRERKSHEIAIAVRDKIFAIAKQAGGNAKVVEVPPGPPVLSPIVAEIYGPDYAGQVAMAKQVRSAFEKTADIIGVDDTLTAAGEKRVLHVLQAKAAQLGVSQQQIADTIALALAGQDVTPMHDGNANYEIPIRLVLAAAQQDSIDELLKLKIRASGGALIPVSELVQVENSQREQVRYHKDLLPVVYVTGDMGGKLDSPLYGMFSIRSHLPTDLAETFISQPADAYAGYSLKWDGEWQITYETFRDMGAAYAVGLILIYLLVVAQFKSYLVPLIIMAPIPLTIIGVMPGHALFGAQFTATSMIGMIALAGIIVRNSILLVDFINQQVAEGMDFAAAVVNSAIVRAKPITLTGLAAMLGALFILDDPIFNGLALSLIFGILVSTVLTLVIIPVLYFAAMQKKMAPHLSHPTQE